MQFDIFTVMAASTLVVVLLGITILLFWGRDRKAAWMAWAAASFCVLAFGHILVMVPDMDVSGSLGPSFLIGGFGLTWQAGRVFEHRRPLYWPVAMAIAIWLGAFFFGGLHDDLALRIVLCSSFMAGMLWMGAYELWRGRFEVLPSRIPAVLVLVFMGSVMGLRVMLAYVAPYPMGALPVDGRWVAGFNGAIVLSAILLTAFLISMTMERVELGQRELARIDPLTGLLNRRGLNEFFEPNGVDAGTAAIVFDLDNFKLINDIYGHAAGDILIKRFTRVCQESIRQVDFAVRMGGEEFALVLPEVSEDGAWKIAERIRLNFSGSIVVTAKGEVGCTVSAGVSVATRQGEALVMLLDRADGELYRAKRSGRNRVCMAPRIAA